jgi:integrase
MSSILSFILQVHDSVHDLAMKRNYSEPKIYTGGVDVNQWSKLTSKEQKESLKKDWYVYFSFRDPNTGYMKQQKRMKASANSFTTRKGRLNILKPLQRKLMDILEAGYNPYLEDNSHVRRNLMGEPQVNIKETPKRDESKTKEDVKSVEVVEIVEQETIITLEEAKKIVLDTKLKVLSKNSIPQFRSRINLFYKWLYENKFKKTDSIEAVTKKVVIQYLNYVLQRSSARNRNNSRGDLSSFVDTLIDNDVLQINFVKTLKKLKTSPKRNKTYNSELLSDIKQYMKENDPLLSLFVDFIYYGLLRPVEVCRLKISDLNLKDKTMHVHAKNKVVKTKIIPNILFNKIPNLSGFSDDDYLFTNTQIGGNWNITEASKRTYFSKRFKKVKDHFELGIDYGLYSFRHTAISELFKRISKKPNMTANVVKSELMLITGHSNMIALESYLRDIDAELPEDFSHLLK